MTTWCNGKAMPHALVPGIRHVQRQWDSKIERVMIHEQTERHQCYDLPRAFPVNPPA
jgi:hypothetical protein